VATLLASLIVALLCAGTLASAAQDQGKITLDFKDVDIETVVKFISQLKHVNFILDDAVKGKVTVISPVPVTVDEAYDIFLSILEVKGFAAVTSGKVVKIIPAVEARAKRLPTEITTEGLSLSDKVVTQLIQLDHIEASRVMPLIKPLISKTSHVEAFDEANTLLLIDVESNIRRILDIIKVIDTPGFQQQLEFIPLEYATADTLASQISSIFGETGTPAARTARTRRSARARRAAAAAQAEGLAETEVKVFADERTNSLIIFATRNDMRKVKDLIAQLDIPPPPGNSRVRIYRLQHMVADEFANVLTGVVTSLQQGETGTPATSQAARQSAAARRAAAAAAAGAGGLLGDRVSIIPDPANNALVITASPEDHAVVEGIIRELDIQPQQVFVEALIVEVRMDASLNLGVEWRALGTLNDNGAVLGNTNFSGALQELSTLTAGNIPTLPTGLALGFLGDTIEFNGIELPGLGALITALKGTSGANIISTPQILTLNNQEAEFNSVLTIPFQTGTSTGTGVNVVSTFDFRDVGTILKITPHINESGYVRMEISQEVSTVQDSSTPGLPTTSKRSATTTAVVKDSHTIVIGGLISNQLSHGQTKVPLLGDIPFLGALFRESRETSIKTNLLIFITPHVINQAEDLVGFTGDRSDANPLLKGEEFRGLMEETFPEAYPGLLGKEGEAPQAIAPPSPAQPTTPVLVEPGIPAAEATAPVVAPGAAAPGVPAPVAPTPAAPVPEAAPPPAPAAAEGDLTERLRRILEVPAGAEAAVPPPPAPAAPPVPSAPPAPAPPPAPSVPEAAPAAPEPPSGDLMDELQRILESDTSETAPAPPAETPPAAGSQSLDERLREVLQEGGGGGTAEAAPIPKELREVEQPLFEEPPRKGWFGRMKDKIFKDEAAEDVNLDDGGSPETAPDAVSPIYRYTPDDTGPSDEGE
jgi:general secretion pathway protein D